MTKGRTMTRSGYASCRSMVGALYPRSRRRPFIYAGEPDADEAWHFLGPPWRRRYCTGLDAPVLLRLGGARTTPLWKRQDYAALEASGLRRFGSVDAGAGPLELALGFEVLGALERALDLGDGALGSGEVALG